ncbi:MAG: Exodeoxyribonuclease 7 small subunit [Gemmatimonadetes bacterium]|nr:Exodeoxyribonuclease 7 small subunit [Gemmatimonadota bacterium]
MKFEERLARLEGIVEELEGDELPLARSLELFEEGVTILRAADAELRSAEAKVQRLVEGDDGEFSLVDLDR